MKHAPMNECKYPVLPKGFLLTVLLVGVLIAIAEYGFRIEGRYKSYGENNGLGFRSLYGHTRPSHVLTLPSQTLIEEKKREFHFTYRTNDLGLVCRYSSKEIASFDKRKTILALGDSFTMGCGAPPDSSWVTQLEALLQSMVDSSFKVINAGIAGNDPLFGVKLYEHLLGTLPFGLVLMAVNSSDIVDYLTIGGSERFCTDGTVAYKKAPRWEFLYVRSFIVRWFVHFVLQCDYLYIPKKLRPQRNREAIAGIHRCLQSLDSLCISNRAHLVVVLHPVAAEPFDEQDYDIRGLAELLPESGIKLVNLWDRMKAEINKSNYLEYSWRWDGHYNSQGYTVFARALLDELLDKFPDLLQQNEPDCVSAPPVNGIQQDGEES